MERKINNLYGLVPGFFGSLIVMDYLRTDNPLSYEAATNRANIAYPPSESDTAISIRNAFFGGVSCSVVAVAIARDTDGKDVSLSWYPTVKAGDLGVFWKWILQYSASSYEDAYNSFVPGFNKILPGVVDLVESRSYLGLENYIENSSHWFHGVNIGLGMARAVISNEQSW